MFNSSNFQCNKRIQIRGMEFYLTLKPLTHVSGCLCPCFPYPRFTARPFSIKKNKKLLGPCRYVFQPWHLSGGGLHGCPGRLQGNSQPRIGSGPGFCKEQVRRSKDNQPSQWTLNTLNLLKVFKRLDFLAWPCSGRDLRSFMSGENFIITVGKEN